jgi:hypothetical protein
MPFVVNDLATDGERVFAGLRYQFPAVLPPGQESVLAFDGLSGQPSAWAPPAGGPWDLLGLFDGLVYLFSSATFGSRFVRVDAQTGAVDPIWHVTTGPTKPRILPVGDLLYLAGDAFGDGGGSRSYLAAVDRRTGSLAPWNQRVLWAPPEGTLTVNGVAVTGQTMFLNVSTPYGRGDTAIDIDTGLSVNPFTTAVSTSDLLAVADGWLLVTRMAAPWNRRGEHPGASQ